MAAGSSQSNRFIKALLVLPDAIEKLPAETTSLLLFYSQPLENDLCDIGTRTELHLPIVRIRSARQLGRLRPPQYVRKLNTTQSDTGIGHVNLLAGPTWKQ